MKKIIFVLTSVCLNTHWSKPNYSLDPVGPFFHEKASKKWVKKFKAFCRSHNEIEYVYCKITELNTRAKRAPKSFLTNFLSEYGS
ncbi:MAG: hypothetical protein UX18_C0011G0009 [Candidatus Azambacteria bacterium GW2011_GWC2_45_7b]|uniref:Uncharacterized protein n=1 Tax=Candidatus Azambacteria bacterium GW2011_GWC2_45_7b TaxID=1618621 RepID=A0A837IH45_9BACT|nr:MAG: hypothetical protein UX18_C0011G0009 [Candidatus Azambacteria bacterium GW2011_GWC2_45_7b]